MGSEVRTVPGSKPARAPRTKRASSSLATLEVPVAVSGPGGVACASVIRQRLAAQLVDALGPVAASVAPSVAGLAVCPSPPPKRRPASAAATSLAVGFWENLDLPVPQPHIAPGRAITGLPAYLETRGTTQARASRPTPMGTLRVEAVGTYTVDWGDGTVTGPHPGEGRPWPDGTIAHQYRYVGSYDLIVNQDWVATWFVGDESGTLAGLRTTARIASFPVGQIQAVGVNPPPRR